MRNALRAAVAPPAPPPIPPHNPVPTDHPDGPPAGAHDPGLSVKLPIDSIDPNPWNRRVPTRPTPDDASLTASIARFGVQENLLVRPAATPGRYELVFGERRLRCARAAGLTHLPAVVRAMDDHEARTLTLTENLHRRQLTFLEEADAVGGLVDEHWTLQQVADELGKPLAWVARRRRLLSLTAPWRRLAEKRDGFTATWGAADFEQIALLEPDAQTDLLTHNRSRLERCSSARELTQLVRSLTCALGSFRWDLGDADLHPVAGACSSCPFRSSQNPGLFDDQPLADTPALPYDPKRPRRPLADRCLNPVCAAKKSQLFLDRKVAALAARHPKVHLLQEGFPSTPIPGAFNEWDIDEVPKSTPGAEPLVVANGSRLGRVLWINPPDHPLRLSRRSRRAVPHEKATLAERRLQLQRRRKIHALDLAKMAVIVHPAPPLSISLRLAIVFGTADSNVSTACHYDPTLPQYDLGTNPIGERHRALGTGTPPNSLDPHHPTTLPPQLDPALTTSAAGTSDTSDSRNDVEAVDDSTATPEDDENGHTDETEDDAEPLDPPPSSASVAVFSFSKYSWDSFETLADKPDAWPEYLWSSVIPVLVRRMTPIGAPSHPDAAWGEALRILPLVGLEAQSFLDEATVALPDPKSWAKEAAAAAPAHPDLATTATVDPDRPNSVSLLATATAAA